MAHLGAGNAHARNRSQPSSLAGQLRPWLLPGIVLLVVGASVLTVSGGVSCRFGPPVLDSQQQQQLAFEPLFGSTENPRRTKVFRDPPKPQKLAAGPGAEPAVAPKLASQRQQPPQPLPADFDWRLYLRYHPDVAAHVHGRRAAGRHYQLAGRQEGRCYKRLRVLLRYTAGMGLMNQQYCHIAAFALAAAAGAEVVLPPAITRDSFGKYFSTVPNKTEVIWKAVPLRRLMDVDKIVGMWQKKGTPVHETPDGAPFPDLVATPLEAGYPIADPPAGIGREFVTQIPGAYFSTMDIDKVKSSLVDALRGAVVAHAAQLLRHNPDMLIPAIVADLPLALMILRTLSHMYQAKRPAAVQETSALTATIFALVIICEDESHHGTHSAPELVQEVAAAMPFSPKLHQLAADVRLGMSRAGYTSFNSLHLRVETDARDWVRWVGGVKVLENEYIRAMRRLGFTADRGCYVASGLLSYSSHDVFDTLTSKLIKSGVCHTVLYKEQFMPQNLLEELNAEQRGLLDFLVMAAGDNFVGFGSSSLSNFMREHRRLTGFKADSTRLVNVLEGKNGILSRGGKIFETK